MLTDPVKGPIPYSLDSRNWLFAGVTVIFATGLLDDLLTLRPKQKLVGQVIAATLVWCGGIEINLFHNVPEAHWLSFPVTVFWLVACTNAFNLIDGLDGLAAGAGFFATATMIVAALLRPDLPAALYVAVEEQYVTRARRWPGGRETFLGNAEILEIFNITKVGKVAGCRVTEGVVQRGARVGSSATMWWCTKERCRASSASRTRCARSRPDRNAAWRSRAIRICARATSSNASGSRRCSGRWIERMASGEWAIRHFATRAEDRNERKVRAVPTPTSCRRTDPPCARRSLPARRGRRSRP